MTDYQSERYARQKQFAPIGADGQKRIGQSDVTILGCGALGSVAAELLCRAGVGCIRLIDRDIVEWTNLQRQLLYDSKDAEDRVCKAEAASQRLAEINPNVDLRPSVVDVSAGNISSLLAETDLVIDATDNFGIRFLLNDWSLHTETAWVHGGCVGAAGQVMFFSGKGAPCFRCLVPDLPPTTAIETCDTAGVIGSATAAIASLQVTEALKWLSGNEAFVTQDVISIDFWRHRIRQIKLHQPQSSPCIACGQRDYQFLLGDALAKGDIALCGRQAVQVSNAVSGRVDLEVIAKRWERVGAVQRNRFFARLSLDNQTQLTLFRDGRVVVHGTDDIGQARSLVDRYVGG